MGFVNFWIIGEKLTEDQVDDLFQDCMPEEDEDGFVDYDSMYEWNIFIKTNADMIFLI